jgi:hypothetical protein
MSVLSQINSAGDYPSTGMQVEEIASFQTFIIGLVSFQSAILKTLQAGRQTDSIVL